MSANEFEGPEAEKPEWFSIVEADTRVRHNVRDSRFRLMALAGPLLLISTGLLFSQTSRSHNAAATESPLVSSSIASGSTELATSTSTDYVSLTSGPEKSNSEGYDEGDNV